MTVLTVSACTQGWRGNSTSVSKKVTADKNLTLYIAVTHQYITQVLDEIAGKIIPWAYLNVILKTKYNLMFIDKFYYTRCEMTQLT